MAPRTKITARDELLHENPVMAPLLVALLREKITDLASVRDAPRNPTLAENGHAAPPPAVGGLTVSALQNVLTTWVRQIEALHTDSETEDS